jgi:hypothetical protein
MTSEVVTNALRYSTGALSLGVTADRHTVRVEVGDEDVRRPTAGAVGDHAESGRGLSIVDALSSSWGVSGATVGKVVWFEVPAQP